MIASGLIDIQAHCKTHTWYFTGADVVDFHRPGDRYPWLAWNARPERKSLYLEEDQSQFVPFGSPVYLHRESLVARRYAPPAAAQERLVEWVGANGGDGLFDSPDWRARLEREARRAAPPEGGRYESDADRIARLREEIVASKVHLEDLLGKRLDFLCWPGGAYDGAAVALAGEAGFVAWTLGSKAVTGQRNMPGEDPRWIRRIPVLPWWSRGGRTIAPVDGAFLKLMIDAYRGSASASVRLKMYKARRLLSTWLK
jgi:hypothetical protein